MASGSGEERGQWNSRVGYILAMVGSAVGLGNLVRFPFITSGNGGGIFVLLYLPIVVAIGVPMVLAELTLGRRSQRNVVDTFTDLGGNKLLMAGLFFVGFNVLVMGWYSVIGGWTLRYFIDSFTQAYFATNPNAVLGYFATVSEGPSALLFHLIFVAITVGVVAGGVADSIEPVVRILMPLLVVIAVALAIYGVTLEGSAEGLAFYLTPDFSKVTPNTITAAIGQAFFSMSVGFGALITYASYMDRDSELTEDGFIVGFSDTGIALLGGFVAFPLLAAGGLLGDPRTTGSIGVAFQALPQAFATLGGALGVGVGAAFFFLLFSAALSSSISLTEVGVGWLTDQGIARWKSALALGLGMYALGIVASFSSAFLNLIAGALTTIAVIIGGLFVALLLGWVYPRHTSEDPAAEMERGTPGSLVGSVSIFLVKYPIPPILVIFLGIELAGALGYALPPTLLLPVLYLAIAVGLGIFGYDDAGRREMSQPLWGAILLLTGPLGLAVYVLIRDDRVGPEPEPVPEAELDAE